MPKSKVRKKPDAPARASTPASPSRAMAPSPQWYPILMVVVLLVGLAYMILYYLTQAGTNPHIPLMSDLRNWNFAVGFGVMLIGLVMAVRWR